MPLPLLFIGIAAATGGLGIGKGIKAGIDVNKASQINKSANELVEDSSNFLNMQRQACDNSLRQLGEEKLFILNSTMSDFLKSFTKIKNVDFRDSVGLDELKEMQIDKKDFEELKELVTFAGTVAGGTVTGTAVGALVAFGAYGAAQALACASTGTAIASLSGAAATNATLARSLSAIHRRAAAECNNSLASVLGVHILALFDVRNSRVWLNAVINNVFNSNFFELQKKRVKKM